MDIKKVEGAILLEVQGASGEIKRLILPTTDLNLDSKNLEEIKIAYGYGDYKTLGTIIYRGKILN